MLVAAVAMMGMAGEVGSQEKAPLGVAVFAEGFKRAKKDSDVVAEVRTLAVVCTDAKKQGEEVVGVTLQLAMQVVAAEKGPIKNHEIIIVEFRLEPLVTVLPPVRNAGEFRFPYTPGVTGSVALRWDEKRRVYVGIAGWVGNPNYAKIPLEVGKAITATESK